MKQIPVVKPTLPPLEDVYKHIESAWKSGWLTNNGKAVQALEKKLAEVLGVKHVLYCTNGTIVLQIALKALGITGDVLTSPYSYVATTSSILWEGANPIFVDIEPATMGINPQLLAAKHTPNTQAIMPVHVYGVPNDCDAIEAFAAKHNIPVIYDAAHAFGVQQNGESLLKRGTLSTLSFHATKVFHTVEGGAICTEDDALAEKLKLLRSFGHIGDDHYCLGINAKQGEVNAAVGLANLPHVPEYIEQRKAICDAYTKALQNTDGVTLLSIHTEMPEHLQYNYPYYPIFLEDEATREHVKEHLEEHGIMARRYFFPSLNTLSYLPEEAKVACPVSESVALRALCLPLFTDLPIEDATMIGQKVHDFVTHL